MTRNTPQILPYCQHCGSFKGVGLCKNPKCDKSKYVSIGTDMEQQGKCSICAKDGEYSCSRCGNSYCGQHTVGKEETKLVDIEQHLGTCVICGAVVCEQCWIFDKSGFVTCLAHLETERYE